MYIRKLISFNLLSFCLLVSGGVNLVLSDLIYANVNVESLSLPEVGTLVNISNEHSMPLLRGMLVNPENPLHFKFIVDKAHADKIRQEEAITLVNYFLAGLTTPIENIWVNLSPYEQNRIIDNKLDETEIGRDLLAQDYVLKQLSSSITHPDGQLGKEYWQSVGHEAKHDEFNKIWIVPGQAQLKEDNGLVLITESSLKVMTEADYLAMNKNGADSSSSSDFIKNKIIPQLEKDVNYGHNFSALRQVYNSLILAMWFKKKFENSFFKHYINQNKIDGIDSVDEDTKNKIYMQYVESFKKGAYDFIKKEYDHTTNKKLKRKYFSGGVSKAALATRMNYKQGKLTVDDVANSTIGPIEELIVDLVAQGGPNVSSSLDTSDDIKLFNSAAQEYQSITKKFIEKYVRTIAAGEITVNDIPVKRKELMKLFYPIFDLYDELTFADGNIQKLFKLGEQAHKDAKYETQGALKKILDRIMTEFMLNSDSDKLVNNIRSYKLITNNEKKILERAVESGDQEKFFKAVAEVKDAFHKRKSVSYLQKSLVTVERYADYGSILKFIVMLSNDAYVIESKELSFQNIVHLYKKYFDVEQFSMVHKELKTVSSSLGDDFWSQFNDDDESVIDEDSSVWAHLSLDGIDKAKLLTALYNSYLQDQEAKQYSRRRGIGANFAQKERMTMAQAKQILEDVNYGHINEWNGCMLNMDFSSKNLFTHTYDQHYGRMRKAEDILALIRNSDDDIDLSFTSSAVMINEKAPSPTGGIDLKALENGVVVDSVSSAMIAIDTPFDIATFEGFKVEFDSMQATTAQKIVNSN